MTEAATTSAKIAANVPSAAPATPAQADVPPHVQLIEMAVAIWRARAIYAAAELGGGVDRARDRKSTRLNSSHANISYAVFCLKKKKNNKAVYDAQGGRMNLRLR